MRKGTKSILIVTALVFYLIQSMQSPGGDGGGLETEIRKKECFGDDRQLGGEGRKRAQ